MRINFDQSPIYIGTGLVTPISWEILADIPALAALAALAAISGFCRTMQFAGHPLEKNSNPTTETVLGEVFSCSSEAV